MTQQGGPNSTEKFNMPRRQERDPFAIPEGNKAETDSSFIKEAVEQSASANNEQLRQDISEQAPSISHSTSSTQAQPVNLDEADERVKKIESILSQDLQGVYNQLSPEKKQEFKAEGEKTSKKINVLLSKGKIKIKEIISLIIHWLKIIPGMSSYFVKQQAKQKAKRIIQIKQK